MEFNNVKDIILQSLVDNDGDYPQLAPKNDILCSNEKISVTYLKPHSGKLLSLPYYCSNIRLKEVFNITISGLMIEPGVNISGIIIENSINIHIEDNIIISSNDSVTNDAYGVGISIINGSNEITIDDLNTSNVLLGVLVRGGNDVMIHNSSFHNSYYSGLYMLETNNIKLQNLVLSHSGWYGISFSYTRYSSLENIFSNDTGLFLSNCSHTVALKISSLNSVLLIVSNFNTNTKKCIINHRSNTQ